MNDSAKRETREQPGPTCTVCGTPMEWKCPKCGSTPALTDPEPAGGAAAVEEECEMCEFLRGQVRSSEAARKVTVRQLGEAEGRTRALEEALRWIPVGEKLPDRAGDFLCARITPRGTDEGIYIISLKFYTPEHGWVYGEGVTHWMEIPSAPKAESLLSPSPQNEVKK